MAEPTIEELQQQIRDLQKLVKPTYTPFDGPEYSFPIDGQGINADEYRQMSLAQGSATIIRDRAYRPYQLVGHESDAETNQKNTLILRVSQRTGVNEAIIEGFYHRMTEDIEIPIEPVTTPTTFFICLTLDPQQENAMSGPISVKTYRNQVPTSGNRKHTVLHTVYRLPNQLLSEASRQIHRPYISPTITAVSEEALPDPDDVLYGTVGVVRNGGQAGAADLVTAEGNRWYNLLAGDWENIKLSTGWNHVSSRPAQIRHTALGYQMRGSVRNDGSSNATQLGTLPDGYSVPQITELGAFILAPGSHLQAVEVEGRSVRLRLNQHTYRTDRVSFDSVIIPYD